MALQRFVFRNINADRPKKTGHPCYFHGTRLERASPVVSRQSSRSFSGSAALFGLFCFNQPVQTHKTVLQLLSIGPVAVTGQTPALLLFLASVYTAASP
jgi:hypothetical protein